MSAPHIIPQSLGPQIQKRMARLASDAAFDAGLQDVLAALAKPQTPTDALTWLHRLQRFYLAAQTGLLGEPAVRTAIEADDFPLWDRYTALPASAARQERLAQLLYEGDPERRAPILLSVCDYAIGIAERILQRCVAEGDELDIIISDPLFQRRLMHSCDAESVLQLAGVMMEPYSHYNRSINLRIEQTQQAFPDGPVPEEIQSVYNSAVNKSRAMVRDRFYTLTCLPTPKDAELDQIPYADYIDLYFAMCDVDWAAVDAAHRVLIEQLDAAAELRFTNNDGTDVTMDVTGFTFCNSLVAKNVPGSEVFSAPRRDSVNGTVVGKGRYLFMGQLMENITLRFEQGRVVEYHAEKGQAVLEKLVETDEGSHYVGEIGIGTNPVLRTHLVNGLLVEKIGGSFHLALGNAYKFTDYLGVPVQVNNGNVSLIHEDITFMLHGKGGRIYVDGAMIMDEGRFLDPRLSALNQSA